MSAPQKIQCRAAVLHKEGERVKVEQITVDPPKPDEVRIKLVATGICASDAHYVFGKVKVSEIMPPERCLPIVLGHEGAGIVESVGANVTELKVGDKVLTSFSAECGKCHTCVNTPSNICETMNFVTTGLNATSKKLLDGTQVESITGLGVYSEYACIDRAQLFKVDESVDLREACIMSCCVSTGYFAALNQAQVKPGSTCAVWGLGGVGLNALLGCKHAGAKNIIGIDLNDDKREIAMQMGCTEFINPSTLDKTVPEYLLQKYKGVDYALDCLGNSQVIDTALASLAFNGTMALVGLAPSGAMINYPVLQLLFGRRIVGAFLGGKKMRSAYSHVVDLYMKGKIDLSKLISNQFSLDQINEAFDLLKQAKCIRSVIIF